MNRLSYRIDPRLEWAREQLGESVLGSDLEELLMRLVEIVEPRPSGAALDEVLSAHRAFLEVAAGGIRLTQSGYLPPAIVRAVAPHLRTMDDWIFAIERESHAQPVLYFREHLAAVGLVRKAKGQLLLTAAGVRSRSDSGRLWPHLAERLVPTRRSFDGMAVALIMLHVATTPTRQPNLYAIADTLTALGWSQAGGGPIIRDDVQWLWNDLWAAFGNVGTPLGSRVRERIVSDSAVLLIRDALLSAQ